MAILVLNPGSTTLKTALVSQGKIHETATHETWDLGKAAHSVLSQLPAEVTAIGCRVVHGGKTFTTPTRVTRAVISTIRDLGELAPLHNFGAAAVLEACLDLRPNLPAVAVFDTAFHAEMPPVARHYALPTALTEQEGLYRYGFHGIVHQTTFQTLKNLGEPVDKLITCHLGGGASLCAIQNGKSLDTSMGFTPLEGLVMASRSGDIDPGLLLHLLHKGWNTEQIEHLLNQESGLLGLSGISSDPRDLFAARDEGNPDAALALDLYTYRAAKYIASFTVALGGLSTLAFSGGVGQNSNRIREDTCSRLVHLGVLLDSGRGQTGEPTQPEALHQANSPVKIWAVPSQEELAIAQETEGLLK